MLVGPGSATNWPPPTYSPQTGLFYVGTSEGMGMSYLTDTDERPEGYGFTGGGGGGGGGKSGIRAIDYKTGEMKWFHAGGGAQGLMSTAGGLSSAETAPVISSHSMPTQASPSGTLCFRQPG